MNLKTRILLASLCLFLTVHSQINIQYGQTDRYLFSTKEALNFTAISMATKAINVQFHGRITAQSGVVVEFKSATVLVNPGANMYSPVNLALSSTDFINQDIAEIERMTGTWPSGDYKLCIWSVCATGDCDGAGQNAGSTEQPACTNIHIENPTPLLLSYPSDNSEIDETRPNYNWIPPAPVAASGSLNYTMTLVEILDGQSKSDALALNRPLIEWPGITNPMLMHPSDIPDLEPGKSYAWQVQAYIGQTYFAKSEQWKFKVKKLETKKDSNLIVLLAVHKPGMENYIVRTDSFRFKYLEQYGVQNGDNLKYSIFNEANQKVAGFGPSDGIIAIRGINDYILYIGSTGLLLKNGVYMLLIENSKGEKWYIRFTLER